VPNPELSPAVSPDASEARFLGYPEAGLACAWTLQDICDYLQVSERKARPLMKTPGAPVPLRTFSDRCDRWNAYEVLAWLHGVPDPTGRRDSRPDSGQGLGQGDVVSLVPGRSSVPGKPWRPAASHGLDVKSGAKR
jgi:hypothetical protein